MSTDLLDRLCDAHVAHIMAQLQGETLNTLIQDEVAATSLWLSDTTLTQLVDKEWIKHILVRLVQNSPYTEHLHNALVNLLIQGFNADLNQTVTLASLVPKKEYDTLVSHVARYEQVRIDVIRAVLSSPIYANLISDVLYHGIKDYVMSDNMLAKKVPGVSSLMKMGAKTVNKAIPNFEASAEGALKKYIAANINRTLALSEKILNNSLDEQNIRKVADHFWTAVSDKSFSQASRYVDSDQIDQGLQMAQSLWSEVRQTDYIKNLIGFIVDHVFAEYGERPVQAIMNDFGFDADYVTRELAQIVPEILANPETSAYLEKRVRAHVEAFYLSPAAKSVLDG